MESLSFPLTAHKQCTWVVPAKNGNQARHMQCLTANVFMLAEEVFKSWKIPSYHLNKLYSTKKTLHLLYTAVWRYKGSNMEYSLVCCWYLSGTYRVGTWYKYVCDTNTVNTMEVLYEFPAYTNMVSSKNIKSKNHVCIGYLFYLFNLYLPRRISVRLKIYFSRETWPGIPWKFQVQGMYYVRTQ